MNANGEYIYGKSLIWLNAASDYGNKWLIEIIKESGANIGHEDMT